MQVLKVTCTSFAGLCQRSCDFLCGNCGTCQSTVKQIARSSQSQQPSQQDLDLTEVTHSEVMTPPGDM